jgi:ribosomal-protein-alanine N-acetyltransferase
MRRNHDPGLSLIEAGQAHAAAISDLHCRLFDPGWSPASILQMLQDRGSVSLVACTSPAGDLAGFILGRCVAGEAEILTIGVAASCFRRGIGGRLLAEWLHRVARAGASQAFLEVASDNPSALALYRRYGFTEVGRRRGYYTRPQGPPCDALLLARELTTQPSGGRPRGSSL